MAVVRCEVASLPASGSLKQKAPKASPVANFVNIFVFEPHYQKLESRNKPSELFTETITEAEASTLLNSSIAST